MELLKRIAVAIVEALGIESEKEGNRDDGSTNGDFDEGVIELIRAGEKKREKELNAKVNRILNKINSICKK